MATPRVLMPQVQVPGSRQERITRRPATHFDLIYKPFQLQPMCCFPVLPGETMKNCMLQIQCWTDPLIAKSKNTPWHFEYFMFYVKMRDLPGWEDATDGLGKDLIDMFESAESIAAHQDADGNAWTYCPPGGVDFVLEATKRIAECYFREEGEAWDKATADGVPLVKLFGRGRRDVHDKLTLANAYTDRRAGLDWDASGTITVDDVELAYREWAAQRDGTELDMDFEDWVRAAGGRAVTKNDERDELHEPEDIAHFREFTYPTNTVEPTTGTPAVAAGWRLSKQSRKQIRFQEWGWVVGYVVCRPKMLMLNQQGLYAAMMQTRETWFPPNMDPRSYSPDLLIDDATGPLKAIMDAGNVDYYVNLRDLMQHGEQFVNYAPAQASGFFATLPEADADRFYPTTTDIMSVFTDTTNGRIRANGVVNMAIASYPVTKETRESLILGKW